MKKDSELNDADRTSLMLAAMRRKPDGIIHLTRDEINYFCEKLSPVFVVNRHTCYIDGSFGTGEEGKSKFTAILEAEIQRIESVEPQRLTI